MERQQQRWQIVLLNANDFSGIQNTINDRGRDVFCNQICQVAKIFAPQFIRDKDTVLLGKRSKVVIIQFPYRSIHIADSMRCHIFPPQPSGQSYYKFYLITILGVVNKNPNFASSQCGKISFSNSSFPARNTPHNRLYENVCF